MASAAEEMNPPPSAEAALAAVAAVQSNTTAAAQRRAASDWLEAFAQSAHCWSIADALLHQSADLAVQTQMAQALRNKIQADFEELPAGAADSLRGSLMELLAKYAAGPAAARSALCQGIAALAAHTEAARWGAAGVVGFLQERIGAAPAAAAALLEILQCVPEEAASFRVALRPDRRRALRDELRAAAPRALDLLGQCAAATGTEGGGAALSERTLLSLATWVREAEGSVPLAALCAHPMVSFAVGCLDSGDEAVLYGAVEALCEVMRTTTPTVSGLPVAEAEGFAGGLLGKAVALGPRFVALRDEASRGEVGSEDEAKSLARLIVEAGDTYFELVARGSPDACRFVAAVLEINAHPDDAICSMTYNFWQRLAGAITDPGRAVFEDDGPASPPPGGSAAPPPPPPPGAPPGEVDRRKGVYAPAFVELVRRICGRAKFPEGHEAWDQSKRSEFKESRQAVADTLKAAASVAGGANVLLQLAQGLEALGQALQNQAGGAGVLPADWRTPEAALYCIRSVAGSVPFGSPVAMQLLQLLTRLPAGAPAEVRYTAVLVVQKFAPLLADAARRGPEGQALLEPVCALVLRALAPGAGLAGDATLGVQVAESRKFWEWEAADAASSALYNVCADCAAELLAVGALPALVGAFCTRLSAEAQGSPEAPAAACGFGVIEEMAKAVCVAARMQPPDGVASTANEMVRALGQALEALLRRAQATSDCYGISQTLDGLHSVFDRLKDFNEALAGAFEQLWPLLSGTLGMAQAEDWVIERLCRLLKAALRGLGHQRAAGTLPAVCPAIGQAFATRRHEALLYVASECVRIVGALRQPDLGAAVAGMLDAMIDAAAGALAVPSAFNAKPYLADDTFLLSSVTLRHAPGLLLREGAPLARLTASAAAGANVQHRDAGTSLYAFLASLLEVPLAPSLRSPSGRLLQHMPEAAPLVVGALAPVGEALLRQLLAGVAGAVPEYRVAEITDVLAALSTLCHEHICGWAQAVIARTPDAVAQAKDKEALFAAFKVCADAAAQGAPETPGRQLYLALVEFKDLCRRNRRSRDAALKALEIVG